MFEMIHVISWKNGITKISEKEYYKKWNIKYPIFENMSLHPGDTLTRHIANWMQILFLFLFSRITLSGTVSNGMASFCVQMYEAGRNRSQFCFSFLAD